MSLWIRIWIISSVFLGYHYNTLGQAGDPDQPPGQNNIRKCTFDDCPGIEERVNSIEDLYNDPDYNDPYPYEGLDYEAYPGYGEIDDDYAEESRKILGTYARYDHILAWQRSLCRLFPEVVTLYNIGQTVEGRPMLVIKVGLPGDGKWGIWIDGGIHGREHIAPATVIYLIDKLVRGYRLKDADSTQMLSDYDWYMLPVLNPDGYEYTHTHNRDWRKNRRKINENCTGVDLNRNWNISWGGADSNSDPCNNVYMGEKAETEPEVHNVVRFILSRSSYLISFITYHSYGQRIFTRWDYNGHHTPDNHDISLKLAYRMASAMSSVKQRDYMVGSAPQLTYSFGGGSADWAKAVAGITYSYLIELPDTGHYQFLLPVEEILPTGREQWLGLKRFSSDVMDLHGTRNKANVSNYRPITERKREEYDSRTIEKCEQVKSEAQASLEYLRNKGNRKIFDSRTLSLLIAYMLLYFLSL